MHLSSTLAALRARYERGEIDQDTWECALTQAVSQEGFHLRRVEVHGAWFVDTWQDGCLPKGLEVELKDDVGVAIQFDGTHPGPRRPWHRFSVWDQQAGFWRYAWHEDLLQLGIRKPTDASND